MRVFVTSTSADLERFRAVAGEVAAEFGWTTVRPVLEEEGGSSVDTRLHEVAAADLVVAIVGWRQGSMPPLQLGGDGRRSWTEIEVQATLRHALPMVVLAADSNDSELREDDPVTRSWVADFRAELDRVAVPFEDLPGPAGEQSFRAVLTAELKRRERVPWMPLDGSEPLPQLELRVWPTPEFPANPYPLLLPYAHPRLLAGRQRELSTLCRMLSRQVPILGVHGPSGAGKSSLLEGGLVAQLRSSGRPVAYDRHPCESGVAGRLLHELIEQVDLPADHREPQEFARLLFAVTCQAGEPPLLVLDQFEDLLRGGCGSDERPSRAVIGSLMAASIQRQPGFNSPPCRWLLAYRRDYHGAVVAWLEDVLREARATGLQTISSLPHDLSGPDRFHCWALPLLGVAPSGEAAEEYAADVFQEVIEAPLLLRSEDDRALYPWRFKGDGARRLAVAFAEARTRQPRAPLAPELQVVLAHLMDRTGEPQEGQTAEIVVPERPELLIDQALEEHLARALKGALPASSAGSSRQLRTRTLLALRELADAAGGRAPACLGDALAAAIGAEGGAVLEQLATSRTRLVVPEEGPNGRCYRLAHDSLAEVVVRLVDQEGRHSDLEIDSELLALRRFVALRTQLFRTGEVAAATEIDHAVFKKIAANESSLLWGDEQEKWWTQCQTRRQNLKRRRVGLVAVGLLVLSIVITGSWRWAAVRATRNALLELVSVAEPEAAAVALATLIKDPSVDDELLGARLRGRELPFDIVERGLGSIDPAARGELVMAAVEMLLPQVPADEDSAVTASLLWALDITAVQDPTLRGSALMLREVVLHSLKRDHPPPIFGSGDHWRDVPGGTFWMGSRAEDERDDENMLDERPRHQVSLTGFRLLDHEVTNAEYRLLVPDHQGPDELPASGTWYQAYVYAAWLGGRLPTEAEWEYAARAGCEPVFCDRLGEAVPISDVAWWVGNASDPESGQPETRAVRWLEPNPWGLYDMLGNLWEWTADWYGDYPAELVVDPKGPTVSDYRVFRGGDTMLTEAWVQPSGRGANGPGVQMGFRVLLPDHLSLGQRVLP